MAPGVRAALTSVFRAKTGAGEADGAAWLAGLRANDRYLEDIWGETAVVSTGFASWSSTTTTQGRRIACSRA
jgi:hypothetical protein